MMKACAYKAKAILITAYASRRFLGSFRFHRFRLSLARLRAYRLVKFASDLLLQGFDLLDRKSDAFCNSSARPPYPQVLQGHLCVARLSGTGVKSVSCRCPGRSLARRPCSQVPHGHLCVPKGSSVRSLARHPSPQVRQRHPRVAKGPSGRFLARRPRPQVPQCHPRVANR